MNRSATKSLDKQLMFSLPEPLVRTSASPAIERGWTERVVTWRSDLLNLLGKYGPAGCCSKTFLAYLVPLRTKRRILVSANLDSGPMEMDGVHAFVATQQTKRVISDTSYPRFQNSGIILHGQSWTLNTSEWRTGASVCSLSDILETGDLPPQYFLTSKACRGILRRAAKRKKTLPEHLEAALVSAAGVPTPIE